MALHFGVNVASLVHLAPWLAPLGRVTPSPTALCARAKRLGFDFVQLLPLRGATGREEGQFCEEAWNPGSVWDLLTSNPNGKLGQRHLQDIVLFPDSLACANAVTAWTTRHLTGGGDEVLWIEHEFNLVRQLVELHPGLDLSPAQIVRECKDHQSKVVIDTHHLQRGYRPDEVERAPIRAGKPSLLGVGMDDWMQTLETLQPVLAPVLHFHVAGLSCCWAESRLTGKWLDLTSHFEERWVVLEYQPTKAALLSRRRNDALARDMLAMAKQICDNTYI